MLLCLMLYWFKFWDLQKFLEHYTKLKTHYSANHNRSREYKS